VGIDVVHSGQHGPIGMCGYEDVGKVPPLILKCSLDHLAIRVNVQAR
jgi:hypothetical protein